MLLFFLTFGVSALSHAADRQVEPFACPVLGRRRLRRPAEVPLPRGAARRRHRHRASGSSPGSAPSAAVRDEASSASPPCCCSAACPPSAAACSRTSRSASSRATAWSPPRFRRCSRSSRSTQRSGAPASGARLGRFVHGRRRLPRDLRRRRHRQRRQHHRRLQRPGVDVRGDDAGRARLRRLPGRRPTGRAAGAGRRRRGARLLHLELPRPA